MRFILGCWPAFELFTFKLLMDERTVDLREYRFGDREPEELFIVLLLFLEFSKDFFMEFILDLL